MLKKYLCFDTHGTRMSNLFIHFCVRQTMLVSPGYNFCGANIPK